MGKLDNLKTDKSGRVFCRTSLKKDRYIKFYQISEKENRSVAGLTRIAIEKYMSDYSKSKKKK